MEKGYIEMSRRMIDPSVVIKSQIVDDKYRVDLNEILEKHGMVTEYGAKTITLQIYNKEAGDENQNSIIIDNDYLGEVVMNGSITLSKISGDLVFIQGLLVQSGILENTYLEISSGSYENGIILEGPNAFDLYVIRV